ncbi:hypothetical protein G7072_18070 [Nocardioides sp. HDW12B]|uniref:hypothetical protein n=1 Tax=Nocardioides sp. HDW12B TaxID=2714939 RepID=UPI00140BEC29|nr:hypothetical protein [Nocardioides sp. HDW12B]QIK67994.1 hypothetical protein G7072_18070 [Nocardioides sp. HDW12B]
MTSTRVSFIAASAAAALWALKGLAIGSAGGLGESPFEGPFFLTGLASFVIASVALGVAVLPRRAVPVRALAGLGVVVAGFAVAAGIDTLVSSIVPPDADRHWAYTEVNLWVVAAALLAITLRLHRAGSDRVPAAAVPVA